MPSVNFSFTDLASQLLASEVCPHLKIQPLFYPIATSGSIIVGNPVEVLLDSGSSATVSLQPNVYNVALWTKEIESTFQIIVANGASESIDATDCLVLPTSCSRSIGASSYRLAPVPETSSSFGQRGWIAFDPIAIYYHIGTQWNEYPVSTF